MKNKKNTKKLLRIVGKQFNRLEQLALSLFAKSEHPYVDSGLYLIFEHHEKHGINQLVIPTDVLNYVANYLMIIEAAKELESLNVGLTRTDKTDEFGFPIYCFDPSQDNNDYF